MYPFFPLLSSIRWRLSQQCVHDWKTTERVRALAVEPPPPHGIRKGDESSRQPFWLRRIPAERASRRYFSISNPHAPRCLEPSPMVLSVSCLDLLAPQTVLQSGANDWRPLRLRVMILPPSLSSEFLLNQSHATPPFR